MNTVNQDIAVPPAPHEEVAVAPSLPAAGEQQQQPAAKKKKKWSEHIEELKAFKERHGHIIVPSNKDEYKSLYGFINHQRHNHRLLVEGKYCRGLDAQRIRDLEELGFKWQPEQSSSIDRLSTITLSFPPDSPLGISDIHLDSYSQCRVIGIEQQNHQQSNTTTSSSPFIKGDIILSINGIQLTKIKGGIQSIHALLDMSLNSSRHLVIQRSTNNSTARRRPQLPLHPDEMTHEQKIEAARERVSNAKSNLGHCAAQYSLARREMKDAYDYLNGLLNQQQQQQQQVGHDDENNTDENDYNDNSHDESMEEIMEGKADATDYFGLNDVVAVAGTAQDQSVSNQTNVDTSQDNNPNSDNIIDNQISTEMEVEEGQAAANSNSAPADGNVYCLPVSGSKHPLESSTAPPPKTQYKRQYKHCAIIGCTNYSRSGAGGVCLRHGAKKRYCTIQGCTNSQQEGGLCRRHGAPRKACSVEGCTTNSRKHGLCRKHGGMDTTQCKHAGCTYQAKVAGFCKKHGGVKYDDRLCKVEGCTNHIQGNTADGVCIRHGAFKARCQVEDCEKPVKAKGYCHRHWTEWKESQGIA